MMTWIGIGIVTVAIVSGMFLSMIVMSKEYDDAFKEWERDEKRNQRD